MSDYKKRIISGIKGLSGAYSPYNVFSDWVCCCSISMANTATLFRGKVWEDREKTYMDTLERYPDPKAVETEFARMMYLLLLWLEADMTDALGEIYMELDIGNKYTGQFFTPFHVSEMCARIALEDYLKNYKGDLIKLNEPSVGGGGMVIAAAKILKEAGINYQKKLKVVAQDLDWKGVYMSHLQFSMLGIQAYIYQGDTLSDPFTDIRHVEPERVMATPAIMGVLL